MNAEYVERCKRTVNKGLCYDCGKPLDKQGVRCAACAQKANKERKLTREWLIRNHICTSCGRERVYGEDKTCFECRAKSAMRPRYVMSEAKKKENSEKLKEQYRQRHEAGICVACGKRKAAAERRKCRICLSKEAERARIRRNR